MSKIIIGMSVSDARMGKLRFKVLFFLQQAPSGNVFFCILRDIHDISDCQIEVSDTEKHVIQSILQSIFSLLYQGCAQNEKNFEAEANIILPDLVFEITKESPIQVLEPFLDTNREPLMDETTCNFCFKYRVSQKKGSPHCIDGCFVAFHKVFMT